MVVVKSHKKGLPPGSAVFTGKKKSSHVFASLVEYDAHNISDKKVVSVDEIAPILSSDKISWLDIVGLHDTETISSYTDFFKLHPLIKEDIVHVDQRPKIEFYDNCVFIVMKMAFLDVDKRLSFEQVSFILTGSTVLTFQERKTDVFDGVKIRLHSMSGKIRSRGGDYLLYALMDSLVDHFFVVTESISDRLEDLEEKISVDASPVYLRELKEIKRDLIFLRKASWPLRDIVNGLERDQSSLISKETKLFLRDLYDHSIQIIDFVETFKDLASGLFDLYNSIISNKMNEIMKVLTIISTIFIPITFIAGLYGMNFLHMPELAYEWSYPVVILVMIVVAGSMIAYFKKKAWL